MPGNGIKPADYATVTNMNRAILMTALLFGTLSPNLPHTSTYSMQSYGFGSGGTANSTTSTYSLSGITGDFAGTESSDSSTNQAGSGYVTDQQANTPKFASVDNGSGQYYNKLHFVIDQQGNPGDAKYLISVGTAATDPQSAALNTTTHEFANGLMYLRADGTLTPTYDASSNYYQTYAAWGGSAGSFIIGLTQNTPYSLHLKATQGAHTESAYGPVVTQDSAAATISFSLATSAQSTPPFTVGLGTLNANQVAISGQTINTSFSTNGASGGNVYIISQNGGLKSGSTGYKIAALSGNLNTASEGFGAQNTSVNQTSGGPFTVLAPFNTSGTSVGAIATTNQSLYTSTTPVTAGSGVLTLLAKAASTDIAATDYQEFLTFTAAANF